MADSADFDTNVGCSRARTEIVAAGAGNLGQSVTRMNLFHALNMRYRTCLNSASSLVSELTQLTVSFAS
jgi:hypothetical protein